MEAQIPDAVTKTYKDALTKKASLEVKAQSIQSQIEKQNLVITGMEQVIAALNNTFIESETKLTSSVAISYESSRDFSKKVRKPDTHWESVLTWMGDREVQVNDVCEYCQDQGFNLSRKQVQNWLNNSRIGGKLERIGNATYRITKDARRPSLLDIATERRDL